MNTKTYTQIADQNTSASHAFPDSRRSPKQNQQKKTKFLQKQQEICRPTQQKYRHGVLLWAFGAFHLPSWYLLLGPRSHRRGWWWVLMKLIAMWWVGTPKWTVYNEKNNEKLVIWGYRYFRKTPCERWSSWLWTQHEFASQFASRFAWLMCMSCFVLNI